MFYCNDTSAACRVQLPHDYFFVFLFCRLITKGSFSVCWNLAFPFVCLQMKPGAKTVASWCIAWLASAARSLWLWLILCRSSICQWMMLTTLSRWRNPTSPPTSTSWASCWTSRGRWDWAAPATTGFLPSSSTSPPLPTRMSTRWTPCNLRERPTPLLTGMCPFLQQLLLAASAGLLSLYVAPGVQMTPAVGIRQGYHVWHWLSQRERFAPFLLEEQDMLYRYRQ